MARRGGGSSGGSHFSGSRSSGGSRGSHFGSSRSSSSSSWSHFGSSRSSSSSNSSSWSNSSGWGISGHSSTGHHHIGGGSRMVFVGGKRNTPQPLFAKIFAIVFFAIFISLFLGGFLAANLSEISYDLSIIKEDYTYYQAMANRAKSNSDYMKTAEITNILQNPNGKKYCIAYKYTAINSDEMYSFYVYTWQDIQALGYEIGDIIYVATESASLNYSTDSVPMDYLNTTLTDDEEYSQLKRKEIIYTIIIIVGVIVIIGVTTLIIVKTVKNHKKQEIERKAEETSRKEAKNRKVYCMYCGAQCGEKDPQCRSCGSKSFEIK